jgi:hypothetical protein
MSNIPKNSDEAYYRSKQPVYLRGTREGVKNPKVFPSYRATTESKSADKYYAEIPKTASQRAKPKPTGGTVIIDNYRSLVDVLAAFNSGAASVVVKGTEEQIKEAKLSVDLAVGQKTLTRTQADSVSFFVVPVAPPEPAPEKTEDSTAAPKKRRGRKKKSETAAEEITEKDIAEAFGSFEESDF